MIKLNQILVIGAAAALCSATGLAMAQDPETPSDTSAESGSSRTASAEHSRHMGKELSDQTFVTKAAQSNMAEIELSKLALEKAESPQVREYAQRMVTDHTKASEELKTLAQKNNLQVPQELDSKHHKAMEKLQKEEGSSFDKAYTQQMKKDHEEAVKLFESASRSTELNPELRSFASKTLPTLQEHDRVASDLRPGSTRAAEAESEEPMPERR